MKEMIDLIANYGFMTVFTGMGLYLIYLHASQKLKGKKVANPLNHIFFTRINQFMQNEITKLINIKEKDIGCKERREEVIKKMLCIKMEVWREMFKDYITDTPWEKMDNTEMYNSLIRLIQTIVGEYNKQWVENKDIPNLIVTRFNEFHSDKIHIAEKTIFDIIYTDFFNSNKEKINAILELNLTLLYLTIHDIKEVFLKYNGEFDRVLCKK